MNRRQFMSHFGTISLASVVPVGAAAQSLSDPGAALRGTRNAKDYGVVADLTVDQSPQFQAMLDSAAADKIALQLPGGMYFISGIRLPFGLVMEGFPDQTQLVHSGKGAFLTASHASGITLRGLVIEGVFHRNPDAAEGLVDFDRVDQLVIEDCRFNGPGIDAIRLNRCSGRVQGNTIADAARFALYATDSNGLTISGNSIRNSSNGGVIIHRNEPGHDGTIVTNNRIADTGADNGGTGEWGNAINFFRADNVTASNNIVSASAFSAIRGNTVRNMHVTGNTCLDNGETAIYAEFGFENAVIANNIVDGAANGIAATNMDQGGHGATITGNVVRNLHADGPYRPDFPGFGTGIGVEADTVVTGNLVENSALYGINAGWGPFLRDAVIASNVLRNCETGIGVSAVEGAGDALITGNMIGARSAGILPHAWGKAVGPDLLSEPESAPANITVAGNVAASS